MSYIPAVDPDSRQRFAEHAAPTAIKAQIAKARRAADAAIDEELWLSMLLDERLRQIKRGDWPASKGDES